MTNPATFSKQCPDSYTNQYTDDTSDQTKHDRLYDKLHTDGTSFGTKRHTDTDLSCTLRDGHQHDIHNADTTHDQ